MEITLVLIKPGGVSRSLIGEITKRIEARDLKVVGLKLMNAPRATVEEHYAEHKERPFFASVCDYLTSGPVVVAEQLPDGHLSKALGVKFNADYEKIHGPGTRNQFGAHGYDTYLMLDKVIPIALKKGKPGTPEFRAAIKEALETTPALAVTHGVLDYSPTDHWGYRPDTGVVMKVVNGEWKLEP